MKYEDPVLCMTVTTPGSLVMSNCQAREENGLLCNPAKFCDLAGFRSRRVIGAEFIREVKSLNVRSESYASRHSHPILRNHSETTKSRGVHRTSFQLQYLNRGVSTCIGLSRCFAASHSAACVETRKNTGYSFERRPRRS